MYRPFVIFVSFCSCEVCDDNLWTPDNPLLSFGIWSHPWAVKWDEPIQPNPAQISQTESMKLLKQWSIVWHGAPLAWSWCDWWPGFTVALAMRLVRFSTCELTPEANPRGWTTVSEGFLCTSKFVSCRSMLKMPAQVWTASNYTCWFSFFLTTSGLFFCFSCCWDQCRHMKSGEAKFSIAQTWSSCRPWREPYRRLISLEAHKFCQFSQWSFCSF